MKKIIIILVSAMLLGLLGSANATLIDLTNGVLHDNETDLYWLQDMTTLKGANNSFQTQKTLIDDLNHANITEWRVADQDEVSEMLQHWMTGGGPNPFTATIAAVQTNEIRSRGYHESNVAASGYAEVYSFTNTGNNLTRGYGTWGSVPNWPATTIGTWTVSGGTNPVPEPSTILLFGVGCLGLAYGSRRHRE